MSSSQLASSTLGVYPFVTLLLTKYGKTYHLPTFTCPKSAFTGAAVRVSPASRACMLRVIAILPALFQKPLPARPLACFPVYRHLLADCFFASLSEVNPSYAAQLAGTKPEAPRHLLRDKLLVGCWCQQGPAAPPLSAMAQMGCLSCCAAKWAAYACACACVGLGSRPHRRPGAAPSSPQRYLSLDDSDEEQPWELVVGARRGGAEVCVCPPAAWPDVSA